MLRTSSHWGLLWRSENRVDGSRCEVMYECGLPLLFRTRRDAREYAEKHYGYIRTREDLRREPHGWKVPKVIRVLVGVGRL